MTARDPDELIRIGQLIDVALDVPPEERRALLARACGSDTALFDKVWAILADLDRDSSFLEKPALLSLHPSLEEAQLEPSTTAPTAYQSDASVPEELERVPSEPTPHRVRHAARTGFVKRSAPVVAMIGLAAIIGVISIPGNQRRDARSRQSANPFDSANLRKGTERARVSSGGMAPPPDVGVAREEVELGRKLIQLGAYDSAAVPLRQAMTLLTVAGGEASLEAADARRLLAHALARTLRLVEAERELRGALYIYRRYLNADDARLNEVLASLADLLAKSGRKAEADSVRNSAVSQRDQHPVPPGREAEDP